MDPLKNILTSEREAKNLTRERVSVATGIPARFLEYLETGNYRKLPPDAYVFGYLARLAQMYGVDGPSLWESYKREKGEPIRSGASDRFPGMTQVEDRNKHSVGKMRALFISAAVVAVLLYVSWQVYAFVRPPEVTIVSPNTDITTNNPELTLSGSVRKYTALSINDEPILLDADGFFAKNVVLQEGANLFVFKVRTLLGSEATVMRRVAYVPPQLSAPPEVLEVTPSAAQ